MKPSNKTIFQVVIALTLLLLVALLYFPFLSNQVIFDDVPFFKNLDQHHFGLLSLRALPYNSLIWTAEISQFNIYYLRIGNLLVHCINCLILFFITQKLLQKSTHTTNLNSRYTLIALSAILLFGLHPANTYATAYLVQRSILMATLFSLLTIYSYIYGCHSKKIAFIWLTVPLYFLAVFSKEHVIMLPAVLITLCVLLHHDWPQQLKKQLPIFLLHIAIAIFVIYARKEFIAQGYEPQLETLTQSRTRDNLYLLSLLTQCHLFFKYWLIWLIPNPEWMSIDIRVPIAETVNAFYLISALAFATYFVVAIYLLLQRERRGLIGWSLLIPWLLFMTELATIRIQEPFVLYRGYAWIIGYTLITTLLLAQLNTKLFLLLITTTTIAFFSISLERLTTLSSPVLIWEDAKKIIDSKPNLPGAQRIYANLGAVYLDAGLLKKSRETLTIALKLNPLSYETQQNLGALYNKMNMPDQALIHLNIAAPIYEQLYHKKSPLLLYNRAITYLQFRAVAAAEIDRQELCKIEQTLCQLLSSVMPAEQQTIEALKTNQSQLHSK